MTKTKNKTQYQAKSQINIKNISNMEELLLKLKELEINLKVVDENLKIVVPKSFDNPTIIEELKKNKGDLISYLNKRKDLNKVESNIPKVLRKESYPLTPAQFRIFLLNRLNETSLAYNQTGVLKVTGALDTKKLQNVFESLIERHECFRMSFNLDSDNKPIQKVLTNISFEIEHIAGAEMDVESVIHKFIRPFNLSNPPLIRVALMQVSKDTHFILIDMHHIASDGVSVQILMREFTQLYDGASLVPLETEYKDYAEWFLSDEHQTSVQHQKNFWTQQFTEEYNILELPYDFPRPKEKTFKGSVAKFNISNEEKHKLNDIIRKNDITLFTMLLGVYGILLSKLSGKNNMVIGTLVAGRKHHELEGIIGMFANTLALPIHIDNNLSFTMYAQLLHQKLLSCLDNDEYPYEELINDLRIERDPSRNPLFDCVFVLQNIKQEAFKIKSADIQEYPFESTTSKFDFTLGAKEDASGLSFELEYATDLFTESTIQRFISYYKKLLKQIAQNPELLLTELSLLSEEEKNTTLNINNLMDVSYPQSSTIIDLFEAQVAKHPNSVAVVYENDSLTYAELNNLSNILAYDLRSQGIGRNDIVGLMVDKNLYTVVGMLGILKSGGCYLPLDPNYPVGRIHYMLEDSQTAIVITDPDNEELLEGTAVKKILLEQVIDKNQEVSNIIHMNHPEDMCYIIYTSGTTGNPKGVMVEHGNVVRLFYNDAFQFKFDENDVWTMFHSHCFDFSVWEMYGALLFGGKVIIIPSLVSRDPSRYLQVLRNHKVTVLNQTPTAFNNLMEECDRKEIDLNELRYVIFGGEALVPFKLKSWKEQYPHVKLVNMYGITEITVHATYKEIGTKEIEENTSNIGKPIPTTSLYILDENKALVPQGVAGEIYIGGAGIARGYLNKEELTNAKFSDNPFRKGERFYRSGDLGRLLENGDVEYIGRIDNQVQLKGFRIELKEIEHHLLQHQAIQDTVVIKRDSEEGHPYLCAYYTGEEVLEVSELRSHLGAHLPKYMIPSYFVKLDEFPVTSNNKIAISKLPSPNKELLGEAYKAPRTEEELQMAAVWEEVLKVARVGIEDNYFSMGGDSLKAIGLISNINTKLGASLTIADLYSYQTIEELAQKLTDSQKDEDTKRIFEETEEELYQFAEAYREEGKFLASYEAVYPMNGVEKGMVFEYLKSKSDDIHEIIYHEQNMYDYPVKNFDFELFKHALNLMIDKHTALRKIYDLESFAHIIPKKITPEINFIDICHLDRKGQEIFVKNKLLEEKRRKTDLSFSLLWRINIIKVRDDYQYLLFDFHHSLFDGWSLSSFLTELLNMYSILIKDGNYVPEPLQSTYKDQIIGELAAAKNQNSIKYWQEELDGYTRFELPTTEEEHVFISDVFELAIEFREELEKLAVKYNTSFKHLCFAAYVYTMNMLSYEDDLTLGMVTNNRPLTPDGDRLLGCFLNTIPFRTKLPKNLTWGDYINYIEDKLRTLKYHERVPFHKILEIIKEPAGEHNPIFDVAFNYLDFQIFKEWEAYDSSIDLEEDSLSEFYLNEHFPFGFHIEAHDLRQEHGGVYNKSFRLLLRYSTATFSKEQVKRLATYFELILNQFLYSETALISKETILSKADKEDREKLKQFNATDVAYETDLTVLDLFNTQVQSNPEKVAVCFEAKELTYGELDTISNQLAHVLINKGVVTDTLVPICVDRSFEMIVGILGILKAGGAYVPIDPAYPESRIQYILEDTKPTLVLTESKYEQLFSDVEYLNLDDTSIYSNSSESSPNIHIPETSLAYVIYTSGTTGNPKGVMNQHDGIYNRLVWMRDYLEVKETDNILQKTTFCFDVSVWELLLPLMSGARLVFAIPEGHKDANYLQELINKEKITLMHFVPSALSVFLLTSENWKATNLRAVICSGEELKLASVNDFRTKFNGVKLHNLYGPTEAAIDVTAIDLTVHSEGNITIGKPIANTQIHIVDTDHNIQPIGVLGELLIGGVQVARGYVNKPELTSEKFIVSPFDPNEKLYKTGDLARWLPNGNIEYLGRNDHQVKIRGHRIELGEIESTLLNYPTIKNVVVNHRTYNDELYLVAYYVTDASGELDIQELKNYLRIRIPEYMIPAYFKELDELPVTNSGKIDRKSLPDPEKKLDKVIEAPQNEEEAKILTIWTKVLGVEASKISVTDNFFDVGGHSLNAMKLNLMIRKAFSKDFNLKDVFNYPTIRLMVAQILEKQNITEDSVELFKFDFNALDTLKERDTYIATFEQRKEFMRFRIKGSQSFNITSMLPVINMDTEVMKKAIAALIDRHEILRTTLFFKDGEVMQNIHPKIELEEFIEEVVLLEGEAIEDVQIREMNNASNRTFNLEKGPWMSIKMLMFPGDTQGLLITMHHSMSDNASMGIVKTELMQLYTNLKTNNQTGLEPLKIQFKEFSFLVNKLRNDTELTAEKFYEEKVKESLAINGNPYAELIKDPNNSYKKTLRKDIKKYLELENREHNDYPEAFGYLYDLFEEKDGAQYRFIINSTGIEKIEKIRTAYGTSNFILLISVFSLVLGKMKSNKSTRMLIPVTTRVTEEFDDVIGWLASAVLTIISTENNMSMEKLVHNVSNIINETSNYRFYNSEKILSHLDLNQDIVAPVLLNYLKIDETFPTTLESQHLKRKDTKSYFNFACNIEHYENYMLIHTIYKLRYFSNSEIEDFWAKFLETIDVLSTNPTKTIHELMKM